jgi:TolB-like protein
VAEGLAAAHAAGVVHRDLKPANVLVDRGGRVVLTDFGIARALSDEAAGARTQGVVGTPLYMAPEQLAGAVVDGRADLYALGLMLFEMLTGARPFAEDSPIAAALARLTRPPPDPRGLAPELPGPLAALVLQCLAQKPDERPADAAEVTRRLRGWLTDAGESLATLTAATLLAAAPSASTTGRAAISPGTPAVARTPMTGAASSTATQALTQGAASTRQSRPVAPVPRAERALAVLPFRYVGPPDQGYLGDALADELIDALSRTRGLRVLGSGAASKFRSDRDPRTIGADLRVDAVVDATVQVSATQLRVTARLVDVETGTQLWSDKFESGLEDLFVLQDRISKRIAEALRVELATSVSLTGASAEAVSLYLRARRKLPMFQVVGSESAVELIEQCLALAPDMRPALAIHALACLRAWFLPRSFSVGVDERDWEAAARASVARAVELAPDLAETQLARAQLAVQLGDWPDAVKALVRALDIAPTYAQAHQFLALLQCEAGNTREGVERAQLAHDLDPTLISALPNIARVHALHGDRAAADRFLDTFDRSMRTRNPARQFRVRIAAWFGDVAQIRDIADTFLPEETDGFGQYLMNYAKSAGGLLSRDEVDEVVRSLLAQAPSPRFNALMCQMCCEIYAVRGEPEEALKHFVRAADGVLIDIEWADRCPVLRAMRALPGFSEARRKVHRRVQAMWAL